MAFTDNRIAVKTELKKAGIAWLYEACGELEAQTKRNSKVSTEKTKGSYQYRVDEEKLEGYVGSSEENAIWEEYGTGEYALNSDGRKGGWWIKVGNGKNEIPLPTAEKYSWVKVRKKNGVLTYVFTYGKKPTKPMTKAYTSLKNVLQKKAKELFGGIS